MALSKPMAIRPYQMLCLICRRGRRSETEVYCHESRLAAIQAAVAADPIVPLTLRCNTDTVFRYQSPGRADDTPEDVSYNDLRDLTILQRIGAVPGCTLPAIDLFRRVLAAIPTTERVCGYPEADAPGWPRCRYADSGNYERGVAFGLDAVIRTRSAAEKKRAKQTSAEACYRATRLRVRPHHLLCLTCFHGGRTAETLAPIEEDNLCEVMHAMQLDPEIPVELIPGTCMVCPPCSHFNEATRLCTGKNGMGLRDEKKDLDTLRRLGLRYGDVLPARELLTRLYTAIRSPMEICGFGDGVERSREWPVSTCCGHGNDAYDRGREQGLGVSGVAQATSPGKPAQETNR